MANTLLTNDIILKTALMEFNNNLVFAKTVRRDYQPKFDPTTGATIRIRKPTRYTARTGATLSIQDIQERYDTMTVSYQDGVDVAVTSAQQALQLDDFNRDVINPAMVTLANLVDTRLYNTTTDIYNMVGTPGSAPASFATINNASALLNSFGIPEQDRFCLLKSFDAAAVQNALYNTFNQNFNKEIIMQGSMGRLSTFDVYSVQNIIRPDNSSYSGSLGTPLVNGGSQSGSSLVTDGWTSSQTGILQPGAIFTIAGVYSLNPTSRTSTGQLAQFTVTTPADSDSGGNSTLSISPSIVTSGPYQNVSGSPANNAAITVAATHTKNIAYHREAFALAVVPLPTDAHGMSAYQKNMVNEKARVSLRMTRQYDITNDRNIIRFDIYYAVKCFPEYATIIAGS